MNQETKIKTQPKKMRKELRILEKENKNFFKKWWCHVKTDQELYSYLSIIFVKTGRIGFLFACFYPIVQYTLKIFGNEMPFANDVETIKVNNTIVQLQHATYIFSTSFLLMLLGNVGGLNKAVDGVLQSWKRFRSSKSSIVNNYYETKRNKKENS